MSDLSRSLVDAAAAVLPVAFCESLGIPEGSRHDAGGGPEDWQAEARAAVAAVLETLAAEPDPPIANDEAVTLRRLLRRLAAEVKESE